MITVVLFTFHYGPIQISFDIDLSIEIADLHSTMVLFKFKSQKYLNNIEAIYIPLWSYSNDVLGYLRHYALTFTFHYGPIQIKFGTLTIFNGLLFTFHYGPIQISFILFY